MERKKDQAVRHRAKLTREAHELARTGKYDDAEAVIETIRSHKDFHPASHEARSFRGALDAICKRAKEPPITIDSKGRKRPRDPNQLANFIVDKAAENERPFPEPKARLPQQERPHPQEAPAHPDRARTGRD
jgi:hypothetical protein